MREKMNIKVGNRVKVYYDKGRIILERLEIK